MLPPSPDRSPAPHPDEDIPNVTDLPIDPALESTSQLDMLSTLAAAATEPAALDKLNGTTLSAELEEGPGDDRSSSLSDIEEGPDDTLVENDYARPIPEPLEDDSEAETERLENTPKKSIRGLTDELAIEHSTTDRSPSKLANAMTIEDMTSELSHESDEEVAEMDDDEAEDTPTARAQRQSVGDLAGQKRKRLSQADDASEDEDEVDAPLRKRSSPLKAAENALDLAPAKLAPDLDVDEDMAEGETVQPRVEEETADHEQAADDSMENKEVDVAPPKKVTKGRKGKGKMKRKKDFEMEDRGEGTPAVLAPAEADDGGEEEEAEEASANADEDC